MSWLLFDRIRAFAKSSNIFSQERIYQDQSSIDRVVYNNDVIDFSRSKPLLDQTNVQINRLERYKDYDQMCEMGEISLALDLYADETCLIDPEHNKVVIVKAKHKVIKDELNKLFHKILRIDNIIRPMTRYLCKYGDAPFEIVPNKDRNGISSIKFMNVYNFTRVETKYGDLVGFFYNDEAGGESQFFHPWQVMHNRLTSFDNIYHPYGLCIDVNTPIQTSDGYKRLKDLKKGDEVYCFDNGETKLTEVVKYVSSGHKNTKLIKTKYNSVSATDEHPIAVLGEDGLEYKMAKELEIGDKLILGKPEFAGEDIEINKQYRRCRFNERYKHVINESKIGYKKAAKELNISPNVTRGFLNRSTAVATEHANAILEYYDIEDAGIGSGWGTSLDCDLPLYVDEQFSRFFGFMLGDGWVSKTSVNLALGEDDSVNEYYVSLLDQYSGDSVVTYRRNNDGKKIAAVVSNVVLADTLRHMGLCGKANEKILPSWVFRSNKEIAINLIQGLLDSDGCEYLDRGKYLRFHHVTSSEDLALGLKLLLHMVGVKSGHIYESDNREFNSDRIGNKRYQLTYYQSELDNDYGSYYIENVTSITDNGKIEVGDIQVESDCHNFMANGIIVHNSVLEGGRKSFKQLRLMEDAALIYRICLTGDSKVWTVDGHKRIDSIKVDDMVYTQNQDGSLSETKVINQVCNGRKPAYEVKTKYHKLSGTATHPFLIKDMYTNVLEYVDLQDLDPSKHLIVSPRISNDGVCKEINMWSDRVFGKLMPSALEKFRSNNYDNISELMRKIDHPVYLTKQALYLGKGMPIDKIEKLCEVFGLDIDSSVDTYVPFCRGGSKLPPCVNLEFSRFIGFYMGDGYMSETNWRVGLALGSDNKINNYYVKLFNSLHNRVKLEYKNENSHRRLNTAVVCDKILYKTFEELGLSGGAHKKRIPSWVYQLPTSMKIEFVKGFIDADGIIRNGNNEDYYEIELCNEDLIEDLKILCDQIGWITGQIRSRTRCGGLEHMNGEYTSYSLCINPVFKVGFEKIEDIRYVGEELVYDITVEADTHNFVANGMTVHNTRAPEKRKFSVPVGNIPTKEIPEYMQRIASGFKNKRFYDERTGEFNQKYSPLVQEDDFFLPKRPDGEGPDVDTLPGAENLDQIADIEYFKKKMVAPLKIPFSKVGIGEQMEDSKSLVQTVPEFAKAVQYVQRELIQGLTKIAICHLALAGYGESFLRDFEISMSSVNAIDELYRMEAWSTRASVMSSLKELDWFPRRWILERFTDMSLDEIYDLEDMLNEVDEEANGEEGDVGLGLSAGGDLGFDDFDEGGLDLNINADEGDVDVGDVDAGDLGDLGDLGGGLEGEAQESIKHKKKVLMERLNNIYSGYDWFIESMNLVGLDSNKIIYESDLDYQQIYNTITEHIKKKHCNLSDDGLINIVSEYKASSEFNKESLIVEKKSNEDITESDLPNSEDS